MLASHTITRSEPISHISADLRSPWNEWSPEALLHHFSSPRDIHYFPVIDPIETDRRKIDLILRNDFEFNGETWTCPLPMSWTHNPSKDQEWLILLHKFYYAVGLGIAFKDTGEERYLDTWMALTRSWIEQVPLDFLPSDVAGRRIQNWIFAHYYFVNSSLPSALDPDFYATFLGSLGQQVNYLCEHLTPHRNHRTLELCAIFLSGVVFPEFQEAERWREFATRELIHNIQSDFLSDGVHCELSTDYHHLVLKNFLWIRKLAHLNHMVFPALVDDIIQQALEFSLYVHKPDGLIPAFSDGDSRCFLDLLEQGHQLYGKSEYQYVALQGQGGLPPVARSKSFPASGYFVLRSGWGDQGLPYRDERYLMFDCGPLGAGNHGHLDLLSFEMAAYGQSLIVDPGRYTYDESGDINWRVRFRETAAHNTVVVDGTNQARYVPHKSRHKIRGSYPNHLVKAWVSEPTFDFVHGLAQSHEYPVLHERKILFPCLDYWIIIDRLTAQDLHQYDLLFHLSPQAQNAVTLLEANDTRTYSAPHVLIAQPHSSSIASEILEGDVSRTYGTKEAAPILRFRQTEINACFHTVLLPFSDRQPELTIDLIPVYSENRSCPTHEAVCLRIRHTVNRQQCEDFAFICHQDVPAYYRFYDGSFHGQVCFIRKNGQGEILHEFSIKQY